MVNCPLYSAFSLQYPCTVAVVDFGSAGGGVVAPVHPSRCKLLASGTVRRGQWDPGLPRLCRRRPSRYCRGACCTPIFVIRCDTACRIPLGYGLASCLRTNERGVGMWCSCAGSQPRRLLFAPPRPVLRTLSRPRPRHQRGRAAPGKLRGGIFGFPLLSDWFMYSCGESVWACACHG